MVVTGSGVLSVLSGYTGVRDWHAYIVLVLTDVIGLPVVIVIVVESTAALVTADV